MERITTDREKRWFREGDEPLQPTVPGVLARLTPFVFFFGLGAIITFGLVWAVSMSHLLRI